ncbi:alkaline phosphatase family protein [Steroidobacter sp. S1-65]|uniref:Alkaline phosphatase family protein n=1 Tax=Steroidobacter gossypii TaxID=2805490 RepID=A0ABS1WX87_9GAMM|nr:alkaline phosphatase family protein [Steroidobacter gossypii]MBM0105589.1 alkaline phosphatase family protein [Steroidobacter gossypii]
MAAPAQRLLLLELNELCPSLIDRFMAEGALPNFKRLRQRSRAYITHTNESVLEPWIQWVTVHTGVPLDQHGILDLDEAGKLQHEAFWDRMSSDNVLLMCPMNVRFNRTDGSIFMPDPWAASQTPSSEIEPFYRFVRSAVNTHARSSGFDRKVALDALRYLVGHGMSAGTCIALARQLISERIGSHDVKWRRASLLDKLCWDVFAHFWRSERRPRIGVFFSNATAHYQHKYWRHHDPDAFSLRPDATELRNYSKAIRYGYQGLDELIGKALAIAGSDTAIVLCTALSQQPMLDYEERGGKAMFLPKDFKRLLDAIGAPANARVEQIMAEEARLHYNDPADAELAQAVLREVRTSEGHTLFKLRGFDGRAFIIGCGVFSGEVRPHTRFTSVNGLTANFHDHFLLMPTTTSAKHHPDGVLWVALPSGVANAEVEHIALTQVRTQFDEILALHSA